MSDVAGYAVLWPQAIEWIGGNLNLNDLTETAGGAVGTNMTDQLHEYRGYYINIVPHGGGLCATIYAPDSKQPMLGPRSDDPTDHDEILDQAKRFIDALLGS